MARKVAAVENGSAMPSNPYNREPERGRWNEGFDMAMTTTESNV